MTRTSFAQATTVNAVSSHVYSAEFRPDWCIGSVPHGGYVTSVFLQVVKQHFQTTFKEQNQPHTLALGLNFLRRTEVGEAIFTVKEVKVGRQTSVVHVTLSQNDREEVVGYITQTNLNEEQGRTFDTKWTLDQPPPPVDLKQLEQGNDKHWYEIEGLPNASFRKASQQLGFCLPRRGQQLPGAIDEWIHFKTSDPSERFTNVALGLISDMFPQVIETLVVDDFYTPGMMTEDKIKRVKGFWYPTVLLNLDIKKALPPQGVKWLFARVRAKQVKNGRYDLEVIIMDEIGELVALSNHIVLVLDASRNLAQRSAAKSSSQHKL